MAIKTYKPMTNGQRGMSTLVNEEITKSTPEKSLVVTLKKKGGRNNTGRITVRHHGGGAKRKYRIIDFKRNKDGVVGTVSSIEYDPNRSSNIALITYADGEKRYIIAPKGLKVGNKIESGENAKSILLRAMKNNLPRPSFSMNYFYFRALEKVDLYNEYSSRDLHKLSKTDYLNFYKWRCFVAVWTIAQAVAQLDRQVTDGKWKPVNDPLLDLISDDFLLNVVSYMKLNGGVYIWKIKVWNKVVDLVEDYINKKGSSDEVFHRAISIKECDCKSYILTRF